jgi:hypothetical protein
MVMVRQENRSLNPRLSLLLVSFVAFGCVHAGLPENVPLTGKGRRAVFADPKAVERCDEIDEVTGEARGDSIGAAVRAALNEAANLAGEAGANTVVYGKTRYVGSWGVDAVRIYLRAYRCPAPDEDARAKVEATSRASAEAEAASSAGGPPPAVP